MSLGMIYSLHWFIFPLLSYSVYLSQIDRIYLATLSKIAIIDHEKKRTIVLQKEGMPDAGLYCYSQLQLSDLLNLLIFDSYIRFYGVIILLCLAVVWNPWDKRSKAMPDIGDDDYKTMLCVVSAAIETPITLKPSEEWKAREELSTVSSSYFSGQLDPRKVLHGHS